MNAEGMLLMENLSRANAIEIQEARNYPPGGNDPGVAHAVPMNVGTWCHQMWDEYANQAQRKLREDRKNRMHQMLKCYDGYSKDRNPTPKEDQLRQIANLAAAASVASVSQWWDEAALTQAEEDELTERTFQAMVGLKEVGSWAFHQMAHAAREAASGYSENRE